MPIPEEKERDEERASEKSRTRKDLDIEEGPDGELAIDDPSGDEDIEVDDGPKAPHGYHAMHDAHDFLEAGHDMADEHLQLADNPKVKEWFDDFQAQLQAMAGELRQILGEEYPEHPGPEPFGLGTEEEGMDDEDGMTEESEDEMPPEKEEGDEDEEDTEKSCTRKSKKTRRSEDEEEPITSKSISPAAYRALERKCERLLTLVDAEFAAE